MKLSVMMLLLLAVMLVNIRAQTQTNQPEDDTDSMLQLSKIIISTIEKYDHTCNFFNLSKKKGSSLTTSITFSCMKSSLKDNNLIKTHKKIHKFLKTFLISLNQLLKILGNLDMRTLQLLKNLKINKKINKKSPKNVNLSSFSNFTWI